MLSKDGIVLLHVGLSGLMRERGWMGADHVSVPIETSMGSYAKVGAQYSSA